MKSGAESAIRRSAQELVLRAAEAGMAHPEELLQMTPREIEAEFRSLQARRQQRAEEMDLLAWLTGYYAAVGIQTPKRFPRRPNAVAARRTEMSDEQMRRAFVNMAERRKDTDGSC